MSLSVIKEKGLLIGVHESFVELPIRYVVHTHLDGEFAIGIYYDRYLKGDEQQRCPNSDFPFASWKPGRGLITSNFHSTLLRDAGLWPELEAFCERAYAAWQKNQKGGNEQAQIRTRNAPPTPEPLPAKKNPMTKRKKNRKNVNDALELARRLREQQAAAPRKKKKKKPR